MAIKLGSNFDMKTSLPLDARSRVDTIAQRDAIPEKIRYIDLEVYVAEEGARYVLKDGIKNEHWVKVQPHAHENKNVLDSITASDVEKLKNQGRGNFVYLTDDNPSADWNPNAIYVCQTDVANPRVKVPQISGSEYIEVRGMQGSGPNTISFVCDSCTVSGYFTPTSGKVESVYIVYDSNGNMKVM